MTRLRAHAKSLANLQAATALTTTAQQVAYSALLRVENPTKDSPNTIDCASCHLATPAAKLVAEPKLGLSIETAAVIAYLNDDVLR